MKPTPKKKEEYFEEKAEKKSQQRLDKKRPRMRVSGKQVFELKKIFDKKREA